jgi:hypothetical protein
VPASAANGIGFAWIRVAHASPDAPNVDIWVNGSVVVSDLAFAEVTPYLHVPAGDYNIKVTPTGVAVPVVIDADVTLEKGTAYTVAAVDVLASIEPLVLVDDNSALGPAMARVNFVHLSPDAPNVDIWIDGAVEISDLAFKEFTPYLEVPAGTYNAKVTPTGLAAPVVIDVDVTLEAGTVYTAFAEGMLAEIQPVVAAFAPRGHVWYLAEGCTEADFETWVLVQNPNDVPATVGLTFMTETGPKAGPIGVIPAFSRRTWKANDYVTSWQVSTEVTSDQPVVAERAMYDVSRTWAHDSIGVTDTAQLWYLPEGATDGGFETFILIQNPNPGPVTLNITFMTSTGPQPGPTGFGLAGHSRITFYVNDWVTDYNVSTEVNASGGVIAERAMYGNNRTWAHNSIGYAP